MEGLHAVAIAGSHLEAFQDALRAAGHDPLYVSAVCSRIAYSDQKRPWCSYLLPAGEGAPQGRMRAELLALARKSPHPAVPARPRKRGSPRSPREKERTSRRVCNSTVKRARYDNHAGGKPSIAANCFAYQ